MSLSFSGLSLSTSQLPPRLTTALTALGALVALSTSVHAVSTLWTYFLRPSRLHKYYRPGSWALVTGASDGIGKAFVEELASRGFNVVLHGRNPTKLEGVKASFAAQFPHISFKTVILDAGSASETDISTLVGSIRDLPLTLLVNNVGGSGSVYPPVRPFEAFSHSDIEQFLDINASFPAQLTRVLLPVLRRSGPSAVLNVGSIAGVLPSAYLGTYAGTKAFDMAWSRSLAIEQKAETVGVRARGEAEVEVLGLLVGLVRAERENVFCSTQNECASGSLRALGWGDMERVPHWRHALMWSCFEALPAVVRQWALLGLAKKIRAEEDERRRDKKD